MEPTDHTLENEGGVRFYKPELDALRFFAFLMVFFHHIIPHRFSFYEGHANQFWAIFFITLSNIFSFGLPLFFLLSAYLITSLLLIERQKYGKIRISAFYFRRILRIWPLYYLATGIGYTLALHHNDSIEFATIHSFWFFWGNWFIFSHDWVANAMIALWSISVEEQFYFFLPLLLAFLPIKLVLRFAICLCFVALITLYWYGSLHLSYYHEIWTSSFTQLLFFGCGMALADIDLRKKFHHLGVHNGILVNRTAIGALSFVALFLAASGYNLYFSGVFQSGMQAVIIYLLVAIGCILLLRTMANISHPIPKFVLYLGKISFGLYVFHVLSIQITIYTLQSLIAGFPVVIARLLSLPLTIAIAAISYQYLEAPFLRLRKRFTYIENRSV